MARGGKLMIFKVPSNPKMFCDSVIFVILWRNKSLPAKASGTQSGQRTFLSSSAKRSKRWWWDAGAGWRLVLGSSGSWRATKQLHGLHISKLTDPKSSYDPIFFFPFFFCVLFLTLDVYDFNPQTARFILYFLTKQVKLGLSNAYILIFWLETFSSNKICNKFSCSLICHWTDVFTSRSVNVLPCQFNLFNSCCATCFHPSLLPSSPSS